MRHLFLHSRSIQGYHGEGCLCGCCLISSCTDSSTAFYAEGNEYGQDKDFLRGKKLLYVGKLRHSNVGRLFFCRKSSKIKNCQKKTKFKQNTVSCEGLS